MRKTIPTDYIITKSWLTSSTGIMWIFPSSNIGPGHPWRKTVKAKWQSMLQSILLYRKTKVQRATHQISLLKLEDGDDYHYVYIKDYDRLIGSQTDKKTFKLHHCFHCKHGFQSQALLDQHNEKGCMAVEGQRIEMPNEEGATVFKNHYKKLKAPFVTYADFERLTTKTGTVSTKELRTDKYQHHRPCGFIMLWMQSTAQTKNLYGVRIAWTSSKRWLKW